MTEVNRPKVGVGVIVMRDGKILLGKRKNAHGNHTFNFPGGHLEFGEDIIACAIREAKEETGLSLNQPQLGPYTNDIFLEDNKHYITIFVIAQSDNGSPHVLEPDKCEGWDWYDWDNLPKPLFLPIQNLIKQGYKPKI